MSTIEINQGEIKLSLTEHNKGKITLDQLGISGPIKLESGLLRLVFEFGPVSQDHFYQVPTIELSYQENMTETHWQCDYNEETILDKLDHHGRSTVILLDRKKLESLEHRHINELILHAEFPEQATLLPESSWIRFF